ncbi:EthD domain-containing protein [Sphingomonas sp. 2R-10]|uniref:EthD domain-containing protein n=1 Tax=Sphingomonas sp. 2R-10 TaxID=3045148 RepID=UPI0013DDBD65|nr:EthD domain-containing protein [Sphingomonas sp. 2R-10]MDJ0278048.1 EthD domain-containing protein [Sphingomonas sp. 2R-10]
MIKLNILIVRKEGLTHDEFAEHWRTKHLDTVKAPPSARKYMRRYLQSHPTGDTLPVTPSSKFDGIAEVWFDSVDDVKAFFASSDYIESISPDEEGFIDGEKTELLITNEIAVFE